MNIFGKTLLISLLTAGMLASCSSFRSTPTTSQADRMETAISTVSTAFAETQRGMPTATANAPTELVPAALLTLTAKPTATDTPTSTPTPIPAFTETPTLIHAAVEPYAVVSSDKAEFWFPLPDRQEWEWGLREHSGGQYAWSIRFGNPQDYGGIAIRCGYPKPEASQTGSFEDMLKTYRKSHQNA